MNQLLVFNAFRILCKRIILRNQSHQFSLEQRDCVKPRKKIQIQQDRCIADAFLEKCGKSIRPFGNDFIIDVRKQPVKFCNVMDCFLSSGYAADTSKREFPF